MPVDYVNAEDRKNADFHALSELLLMYGAESFVEVVRSVHAERADMIALHERNKVLQNFLKYLWPIVSKSAHAFTKIVQGGAMFLPRDVLDLVTDTIKLIEDAREMYAELN